MPYPATHTLILPVLPPASFILYITFFFCYVFITPQGVEPWAFSLCCRHPAWFFLLYIAFCIHSSIYLPLVGLFPPLHPQAAWSRLPALPNSRPCPASRPPPIAALPIRSPKRNPDLHAPSTTAAPLPSHRHQSGSFLLPAPWFVTTLVPVLV